MKIIVFGPTGGVGQHFVETAVKAGHTVTAFSRTPEKLKTDYKEAVDTVPKGSSSIPRASVAHFMVKALDDAQYENKSVGLCS